MNSNSDSEMEIMSKSAIGEDDLKCAVCLDPNIYSDNCMVVCNKCKVCVHQSCYGVPFVPSGPWLCNLCNLGMNPSTTACILCSNLGGAYKPTDQFGEWVHALCASWVPEVYCLDARSVQPFVLKNMDKKRYKLRCCLCSTKGACIQCCYGRCAVSAHPMCALNPSSGFTRRIVKNEAGETLWEIFCKNHAEAVKDPLKKSKVRNHNEPDEVEKQQTRKSIPLNSEMGGRGIYDSVAIACKRISNEFCKAAMDTAISKRKTIFGKRYSDDLVQRLMKDSSSSYNANRYVKANLSEWPGQTEGEGLDLDHFWNVASMAYAEDHPSGWWTSISTIVQAFIQDDSKKTFEVTEIPILNSVKLDKDVVQIMNDLINECSGSRGLSGIFDLNRREEFQNKAVELINRLRADNLSACESVSTGRAIDLQCSDVATVMSNEVDFLTMNVSVEDKNVFSAKKKSNINSYGVVFDASSRYFCEYDLGSGDKVKECNGVDVSYVNGMLTIQHEESNGKKSSPITDCVLLPNNFEKIEGVKSDIKVNLSGYQTISDSQYVRIGHDDRLVISKEKDDLITRMLRSDQHVLNLLTGVVADRLKILDTYGQFEEKSSESVAKHTEWAVLENLYAQQRVWKVVCSGCTRGLRDQVSDFNKHAAEAIPKSWQIQVDGRPPAEEEEDEAQDDAVCMVCFDGTSVDGNRIMFCDGCNASLHQACYGVSEIPEGDFFCDRCSAIRTLSESSDDNGFDISQAKDAVRCCLCPCAHGGIKPTTDGQWSHLCCSLFSYLCNYDIVSNGEVLNRNIEGGLLGSIILDLVGMSPIDVSTYLSDAFKPIAISQGRRGGRLGKREVDEERVFSGKPPVPQRHMNDNDTINSPNGEAKLVTVPIDLEPQRIVYPEICGVCGIAGGLLVRCSESTSCYCVFHPLCAWFEGFYFEVTVSDPSFLGGERMENNSPLYPSGARCSILCCEHSYLKRSVKSENIQESEIVPDKLTIQQVQRDLRLKYKINEIDLMQIPGMQHRKKKKKAAVSTGRSGPSATNIVMDPMIPDTYDSRTCASCMMSIAIVPFGKLEASAEELERFSKLSEHITCTGCGISLHTRCFFGSKDTSNLKLSQWQCRICWNGEKDPVCVVCPRRGGYFYSCSDNSVSLGTNASENNWIHCFCARHCPGGHLTLDPKEGVVDINMIPKECRKQKCSICLRKYGVTVPCHQLGCNVKMHALCAEMSGRAYLRIRNGLSIAYCENHVPEGTLFLKNLNAWVDIAEVQKLRLSLDTARIELDLLNRREKLRKRIFNADGDIFTNQFYRLLDKAAGRKSNDPDEVDLMGTIEEDDEMDYADLFEAEEKKRGCKGNVDYGVLHDEKRRPRGRPSKMEGIEGYDDNDDELAKKVKPEYIVLPGEAPGDPELIVSSTWVKRGKLHIPKKMSIFLSGQEIANSMSIVSGDEKKFMTAMLRDIEQSASLTRKECGYFSSSKEFEDFLASLEKDLNHLLSVSEKSFIKSMKAKNIEVDFKGIKEINQVNDAEIDAKLSDATGILLIADRYYDLSSSHWRRLAKVDRAKKILAGELFQKLDSSQRDNLKTVEESDCVYVDEMGQKYIDITKITIVGSSSIAVAKSLGKPQNAQSKLVRVAAWKGSPDTERMVLEDRIFSSMLRSNDSEDSFTISWEDLNAKNNVKGNAKNFNGVLSTLNALITNSNVSADILKFSFETAKLDSVDYHIYDADNQYKVERRIQFMLDVFDSQMVFDENEGSGISGAQILRQLANDYQDIPYEYIADYDYLIRHPINFPLLRENLQKHKYLSFASFSHDFYEMLNNGRSISLPSSQIWKDAALMSYIFQKARVLSLARISRKLYSTINSKGGDSVQVLNSEQSDYDFSVCGTSYYSMSTPTGFIHQCIICDTRYEVRGWPKNAWSNSHPDMIKQLSAPASDSESGARRARTLLGWICPECICKYSEILVRNNTRVAVFWGLDNVFYTGCIDRWDSSSGFHRVKYDDLEWIFIDLSCEVVLYNLPLVAKAEAKRLEAGVQSPTSKRKLVVDEPESSGKKKR